MRSMPTALKTLIILLLVVLMPLRAMAAVTIGFCATGHDHSAVAAHGSDHHGAAGHEHHGNDDTPAKTDAPSCSSCVEHCSGAAFAPAADRAPGEPAVARDRTILAARAAPAFFSDQLDRPPLA